MKSKLYTKVENFMDFFVNFQAFEYEGKQCQEINEAIKDMVGNIFMFQEEHLDSLTKIHEMYPHDKECYIFSYNKCIKRAQDFETQDSKICKVCPRVRNYIDAIVEDLKVQQLEIGG